MKLRILNEQRFPLNLNGCDGIKILFQYENGHTLEKKSVNIINKDEGKIQVELSDFEIQGLKVGDGQTFRGELVFGETTFHVVFSKALNVELVNERKSIAPGTTTL